MNDADKQWAEDWYYEQYHEWNKHCEWANVNKVQFNSWREYLLEHIEANLIKHKTTKCRNRRMRHMITVTWPTLDACEIISRLDLNA